MQTTAGRWHPGRGPTLLPVCPLSGRRLLLLWWPQAGQSLGTVPPPRLASTCGIWGGSSLTPHSQPARPVPVCPLPQSPSPCSPDTLPKEGGNQNMGQGPGSLRAALPGAFSLGKVGPPSQSPTVKTQWAGEARMGCPWVPSTSGGDL